MSVCNFSGGFFVAVLEKVAETSGMQTVSTAHRKRKATVRSQSSACNFRQSSYVRLDMWGSGLLTTTGV